MQAVDGRIYDPGKSAIQSLSIDGQTGRTTHFDMDEVEVMDETKGAAAMNLPAEAVREVIVSRVYARVVSVAECCRCRCGLRRARVEMNGTAICLEICATRFSAWQGFPREVRITAASSMDLERAAR